MCSLYWNLNTKLTCPDCGKESLWNLQTHFMGDFGSCINKYKLDQKVDELKDVTVSLDGKEEGFCGHCSQCHKFFDFGGEINNGKVTKVFFI